MHIIKAWAAELSHIKRGTAWHKHMPGTHPCDALQSMGPEHCVTASKQMQKVWGMQTQLKKIL
jgi:hypothetical protein